LENPKVEAFSTSTPLLRHAVGPLFSCSACAHEVYFLVCVIKGESQTMNRQNNCLRKVIVATDMFNKEVGRHDTVIWRSMTAGHVKWPVRQGGGWVASGAHGGTAMAPASAPWEQKPYAPLSHSTKPTTLCILPCA
jgi:hypothetical protein